MSEEYAKIDWNQITAEKKELLLRIAELVDRYSKMGVKRYAGVIAHELSVSGRDVGLAKKLMDLGVIKVEDGVARWDDELEMKLRERATFDLSTAQSAVSTTVQGKIAERATLETQAILKAGESYRREFMSYLVLHGERPENWIEKDPDTILRRAFTALDEVEELRKEIDTLRRKLAFYERYLDPYVRLERGLDLLTNALILDRIYELFGLDFVESKAGKAYLKLVDKFLGGEFLE